MAHSNIRNPKVSHLLKNNVVLLVIDKQNGYLNNPFFWQNILDKTIFSRLTNRIDKFVDLTRDHNVPIIWTQMIENRHESPDNIAFKILLDETADITKTDCTTFDFFGRTAPQDSEKVIIKKRYDAFAQTDLNEYLSDSQIKNIIIVGAFTSRCVLATAFSANSLGYNIFVVSDLVGVPRRFARENKQALSVIDSVLGFAVGSKEIINIWNNKK